MILNQNKHNIPRNAVFIGRPSKLGNPFVIGRDGTRSDVIKKFEIYIRSDPELVNQCKTELKGKILVCFCAPLPCHGHILQKIANER